MNGFKIVRANEPVITKPLFITLFGSPGIGKTSLSFTMPGPVLFFDFDKGIGRASQKIRPDYFDVTNAGPFLDYLASDDFEKYVIDEGYQSVVIDTAGTLLDDYLAEYVKTVDMKNRTSSGGLSLSGWGAIKDAFNSKIRNRLQALGLHICVVAHDKDLGEDSIVRMGLSVSGGSSDIIERVSDQIGYMYAEGNKIFVNFSPRQQRHKAKDTAQIGKVEVPLDSTKKYDTFLASVVEACQTRISKKSEAQLNAIALIETYTKEINLCVEPGDFAEMGEKIGTEKGAVLLQLREAFKARMAEAGITYNKEAGIYETSTDSK